MVETAMNKLDDAWAAVKKLPSREQRRAAEAMLDFAASLGKLRLSDEQVGEVKRRLNQPNPKTMTANQARARLRKRDR
jgi:hypothetical protein